MILPHLQYLAPDQSGHAKPGEGAQREGDHHVIYEPQPNYPIDAGSILEGPHPLYEARPESGENKEHQENLREGGGYFSYSHYHRINDLTEVAADQSQSYSQSQRSAYERGQGDDYGGSQSKNDSRQLVSSQSVGAERVAKAGALLDIGKILIVVAIGRYQRSKHSGAIHYKYDPQEKHGEFLPEKAAQ